MLTTKPCTKMISITYMICFSILNWLCQKKLKRNRHLKFPDIVTIFHLKYPGAQWLK